jgi:hypothetical protein
MTRSLRTFNRLILLGLGIVALALGAGMLFPRAAAVVIEPAVASVIPSGTDPRAVWAVLAAASGVAIAFALAWILTRGRGRTSTALESEGVEIDARVIASILRERLGSSPDVLAVDAGAFVRDRTRLVRVAITTRRHPDLVALRAALADAVDDLDAVLGARLPLVIHLTTGLRTAFTGPRSTH